MEIPPEALVQLKIFTTIVKENPQILHSPQLAFFKEFIESFGCKIPPPSKTGQPSSKSPSTEGDSTKDKKEEPSKTSEQTDTETEESDVELDMTGVIGEFFYCRI